MSHYPRFSWLERGTVCREVAGSIPTKTPKIEDSNLSTKRFQHSYKTIFLRRDENNIDQCGTPPSGQSEAHAPGHFAERKLNVRNSRPGNPGHGITVQDPWHGFWNALSAVLTPSVSCRFALGFVLLVAP